jgi:hypothetical protein
MARRFELHSKLTVVVDLAVEHDPDRTIFVVDRLLSRREVDDAQAPHAETDARLHMDPLVVRPAMPDDVAHPADEPEVCLVLRSRRAVSPIAISKAGYSTHVLSPVSISWEGIA